jgi:arylsulfatase A-like enzyme
MDGFRPDYATLAPMHHLHALMARGMTYDTAWVGQMESETPTGHATIGTGVYPRKHGVTGFGFRDLTTGQFTYMPTDIGQIKAGNLTRIIERGGVPTISDLIHARNRHDLTVSMSGEKYYAAATMGAGADYVLYGKDYGSSFRPVSIGPNVPPAASRFQTVSEDDSTPEKQDLFSTSLAIQLLRTLRPRALFLNLPGADIGGHEFGGMRDPTDIAPIVRGDDYAIGRMVQAYKDLGLLNRTVFVVVADHGMASNRHIVPIHAMYKTVADANALSMDEEFRITVGSIWLRDPARAAATAAAMTAKHFPGVEGALYKVSTPSGPAFVPDSATAAKLPRALLHAYVDLADTEAGPTGPDVVLPYGEDTTGLTVKGRKLWGTHGGFSWGVQHIPLIIAGPGVRTGVSHFPAKLVDVAPTIERLLGLPIPSGVDGVVLADALKTPTVAEREAQKAVQTGRMQDVQALRSHSLAQSK